MLLLRRRGVNSRIESEHFAESELPLTKRVHQICRLIRFVEPRVSKALFLGESLPVRVP